MSAANGALGRSAPPLAQLTTSTNSYLASLSIKSRHQHKQERYLNIDANNKQYTPMFKPLIKGSISTSLTNLNFGDFAYPIMLVRGYYQKVIVLKNLLNKYFNMATDIKGYNTQQSQHSTHPNLN